MTVRKSIETVGVIKVKQFQVLHFRDTVKENGKSNEREVLVLYGLGEDGIIYEFQRGKWLPIPITKDKLMEAPN